MYKFLLYCLFLFPFNSFSTTVIRSNDILFYNGDTLFLSKIFVPKIHKKGKNQKLFKFYSNPKKANQYTAYWTIKDSNLYLVKVLNKITFDWKQIKQEDSLDLKKAFKNGYKNGLVKFKLKNETLFANNRFVLRSNWNWVPTYYEDFLFEFKNGKLSKTTSMINYIDQKNRLNRYTKLQLEMSLYKIIEKTAEIKGTNSTFLNFELTFQITINTLGKFKKFETIRLIGIKRDSSKIEIDKSTINEYLDFNRTVQELKKCTWDKLLNAQDDIVTFSFNYGITDKSLFDKYYGSANNSPLEKEFSKLPVGIQKIFY